MRSLKMVTSCVTCGVRADERSEMQLRREGMGLGACRLGQREQLLDLSPVVHLRGRMSGRIAKSSIFRECDLKISCTTEEPLEVLERRSQQ